MNRKWSCRQFSQKILTISTVHNQLSPIYPRARAENEYGRGRRLPGKILPRTGQLRKGIPTYTRFGATIGIP